MTKDVCYICKKEFKTKLAYEKHKSRKVPCKPTNVLEGNDIPLAEFRDVSKGFHSSMTKEERLEEGIFFTPKKVRDILFKKLEEIGVKPRRILEPSFGSGEFLFDARRLYPEAKLVGVEKNEDLFRSVSGLDARLDCCSFLDWKSDELYDVIIGNPPYFVMGKDEKHIVKNYSNIPSMTGRPNIYIVFLYKCLKEHLETGGILAFIIPTSLYNSSYYQEMRNYINDNTTVVYVETLHKPGFYETGQETMLLVLKKKKENDNYIFKSKNGNIYISPYYKELYNITENTTTIRDLGLGVKTGNVVWNQVKDNLSDDGTLLIYSSNINDNKLSINNLSGSAKKQYVKGLSKPTLNGPVILSDRGYGNTFRFNTVLVDMKDFYAENHINVIYPKTEESIKNLERVLNSFKDERTMKFLKWFVGNGSLSATELETLLPIF